LVKRSVFISLRMTFSYHLDVAIPFEERRLLGWLFVNPPRRGVSLEDGTRKWLFYGDYAFWIRNKKDVNSFRRMRL